MKKIVMSLVVALASVALLAPEAADARRLGGGGTSGLKRQTPPPQPQQPPAQQAAPQQSQAVPQKPAPAAAAAPTAGAAAAAAAPKRSWMGPLAGLAAGLGIAALLSHFGLGGVLADLLTMVLVGVALFFAVRWLLRRFAPAAPGAQRLQFAGAPVRAATPLSAGVATGAGAAAAAAESPLADFDRAAFERVAKLIFIRLQAANDAADVQDLRRFTTPQMFAEVQLELQQRGNAAQRTDVVRLDAEVLDKAEEDGQQVVSVRFHGLIREEHEAPAAPFDETWHFVRPLDGSREWAIAGIAQNA